jgi:hypothetical protein
VVPAIADILALDERVGVDGVLPLAVLGEQSGGLPAQGTTRTPWGVSPAVVAFLSRALPLRTGN